MDDGRIPKKVLFGQLKTGVRKAGRPALRFMEVIKRDLKTCEIDPSNWDDAASERARMQETDSEKRNRECTRETLFYNLL